MNETLYQVDGRTATLTKLCSVYNISVTTVRKRMKAGMSLTEALKMPKGFSLKQYNQPEEKPMKPKKKKEKPKRKVKFYRYNAQGGWYDWED